MSEQFIEKSITIQAPVSKVWEVLVKKRYLEQWIKEFSTGHVVTGDWHLNESIAMTDDDGKVLMKGTIAAFEPNRRLRVKFENSKYTEELTLTDKGDLTLLSAYAGPVTPAEYKRHAEVWVKGLNKIKELSTIE